MSFCLENIYYFLKKDLKFLKVFIIIEDNIYVINTLYDIWPLIMDKFMIFINLFYDQ